MAIFSFFYPLKAQADDDVKRLIGGVALGIVGQVLHNAEQNQQNQPAQNAQYASENKKCD